jgi:predicted ArsR family transcriptional regulator
MTPTQKLILRDLEFGPATLTDLAAIIGVDKRTIGRALRQLRDIHGLVRISNWETGRGGKAPVWSLKKLPCHTDVPRPPSLTKAEIDARRWAKHKERMLEVRRARRLANRSSASTTQTSTNSLSA